MDQQGWGRVRMRVTEAEVAADCADVAHAHVCHQLRGLLQQRQVRGNLGRPLQATMGHRSTDVHRLAIPCQFAKLGDPFDIHQVAILDQSQAQQEDEFCPPGIDLGVLAETGQFGAHFGHARGLIHAEWPEHLLLSRLCAKVHAR